MPEANPFQHLGWFPFCSEKLRVDTFDYWITLGGFKKGDGGSPTQQQIGDSANNAVNLFRNLYAFQIHTRYGDLISPLTSEGFSADAINDKSDSLMPDEPEDRLCPYFTDLYGLYIEKSITVFGGPSGNMDTVFTANTSTPNTSIVRMYDGVTTSEDNFVGYGLKSPASVSEISGATFNDGSIFAAVYGGLTAGMVLLACSYIDGESGAGFQYDYAYTQLEGIDVLSVASVEGGLSPITDAANFLVSDTISFGSGEFYEMKFGNSTGANALEFYTY